MKGYGTKMATKKRIKNLASRDIQIRLVKGSKEQFKSLLRRAGLLATSKQSKRLSNVTRKRKTIKTNYFQPRRKRSGDSKIRRRK